jgi:hypothetical protein
MQSYVIRRFQTRLLVIYFGTFWCLTGELNNGIAICYTDSLASLEFLATLCALSQFFIRYQLIKNSCIHIENNVSFLSVHIFALTDSRITCAQFIYWHNDNCRCNTRSFTNINEIVFQLQSEHCSGENSYVYKLAYLWSNWDSNYTQDISGSLWKSLKKELAVCSSCRKTGWKRACVSDQL